MCRELAEQTDTWMFLAGYASRLARYDDVAVKTDQKRPASASASRQMGSREMGDEYHRKSKSDPADIRWQVDDEHLVRTERSGLSAWTVKASDRRSLATNAHQNPPQSRICATHRENVVGIGAPRRQLFLDRTWSRFY